MEYDENGAANLAAYEISDFSWVVWCSHCSRWHHHGGEVSHRVAHCVGAKSPYDEKGYRGISVGKATGWILADLLKQSSGRKPKGMEWCLAQDAFYPVSRLQPGESFVVERHQRGSLSTAIRLQQVATGQRFTTRVAGEQGEKIRVWRVS